MPRFILALDQGTTSSRALVFDHSGAVVSCAQTEFPQLYPQPGWVEHRPSDLWETQLATARQAIALANASPADFAAVSIANQRETVLLWDRRTGQPVANAIVWQDRRTSDFCRQLARDGHGQLVQERTGLVLDSYFSATKIRWLLDNIPGLRPRAESGEIAAGTVDSWLLWNLSGGQLHLTDFTNASRTLLADLRTGQWDDEMLDLFRIPRPLLPRICGSGELCGHTAPDLFGAPIPLAAGVGDQQAALFGQACLHPGLAKCTYGTGCFLLLNTGEKPAVSRHRLLATPAWRNPALPALRPSHALEGSVFIGGAVTQWLRDGLGLIKSSADIGPLAASVPDTGGVYFVPAFAGLGAPHWDPYARGAILGLTRGSTAAHLCRAAEEGVAHQVADVLDAMRLDTSLPLAQLRVDGGASHDSFLMQFQADILQTPVLRPVVTETTALGAAALAGLSAGFWSGPDEIESLWRPDHVFEPSMSPDEANSRRHRWFRALARARAWEE